MPDDTCSPEREEEELRQIDRENDMEAGRERRREKENARMNGRRHEQGDRI